MNGLQKILDDFVQEDFDVITLISAGRKRAATTLAYELKAMQGEHLCNAFNKVAGVPEGRQNEIDMTRRKTAHERVIESREIAYDIRTQNVRSALATLTAPPAP